MSGIARGRLTEERKSWRKNHPHVRTITISTPLWFCFESLLFFLGFVLILIGFVFLFFFLLWFRVLLRSQRYCLMVPWIWWFGIVLFLEKLGFVFLFNFLSVFFVDYEWIKLLSLFFVILIFLFLLCESWVSLSMILDLLTSLILHVGFVMMT